MKSKHLLIAFSLIFSLSAMSQVPEFWFLDEVNPGQDITLYADGANVQDGSFSCKMTLEQPEVPYLISDNFAVNPGDDYTFTIYFYDNDDRGTLKFYADFYDGEGNDIYGLDPVESTDADEWQELTWSSTVPDGAAFGYILIKFYDDESYTDEAIAWVDNAQFVVGGENLVLNGSYESWPGVGIAEQLASQGISVFPNPATTEVNMTNLEGLDRVVVTNVMGQAVMTWQLKKEAVLTAGIEGLTEGLYFVNGYKGNNQVSATKFLKR